MKVKTLSSILSASIVLLGDRVNAQQAAAAPGALPVNPYEDQDVTGDRLAIPKDSDNDAQEQKEEQAEHDQMVDQNEAAADHLDDKADYHPDDIAKDDPTGVLPSQADQDDSGWFRENSSNVPCYKLAEEGLYDLSTLKNDDSDWRAYDKYDNMVYFNFCHYTDPTWCGEEYDHDNFGYLVTKNGGCELLTSNVPSAEVLEMSERVDLIDPNETQEGLRIMRTGGGECPENIFQTMSLTIDVWCAPQYDGLPQNIQIAVVMDEEPVDPCTIYITMQHQDGCMFWDMRPILKVLGISMITAGAFLMIIGYKMMKWFMRFLTQVTVFFACIVFFYLLNFFDKVDPTAFTKGNATEAYALAVTGMIFSLFFQYLAGQAFRKSLVFGPSLIGCVAGYWMAIYFIIYCNNFFGFFTEGGAKDAIAPLWARVIEVFFIMIGWFVGYTYSLLFMLLLQTFTSAFLIMRGASLIWNWGYPNEIQMMQAATSETNGIIHLGVMFYIYMLWLLGMWIGFFKYQWDRMSQDDRERWAEQSD